MSIRKYLQSFFESFASCIACGGKIVGFNSKDFLCEGCREQFNKEIHEGCFECGNKTVLCGCKPKGFLPDELAYYVPYKHSNFVSGKLIRLCKKKLCDSLFSELTDCMLIAYRQKYFSEKIDVITYVPRAPEKILKKGFDQARELATRLSSELEIECRPFIKHMWLSSEQKLKTAEQRKLNAEKMYELMATAAYDVEGKVILLVDDIVTTGATVNTCYSLLKKAGASKVLILTAAKNVKANIFDE